MNVALHRPWTQEEFFAWDGHQRGRYEFDGARPVAMTGGTPNHNIIGLSLHRALYARLRAGPCRPLGPDTGLATVGRAVRYPDALVTCSRFDGTARTISGVVVVFEVVSPGSGRTDRIDKVREYAAVSSILRYVILEYDFIGATVLQRAGGEEDWKVSTLAGDEVLRMPEIGIEIPVSEFYEGMEFRAAEAGE